MRNDCHDLVGELSGQSFLTLRGYKSDIYYRGKIHFVCDAGTPENSINYSNLEPHHCLITTVDTAKRKRR